MGDGAIGGKDELFFMTVATVTIEGGLVPTPFVDFDAEPNTVVEDMDPDRCESPNLAAVARRGEDEVEEYVLAEDSAEAGLAMLQGARELSFLSADKRGRLRGERNFGASLTGCRSCEVELDCRALCVGMEEELADKIGKDGLRGLVVMAAAAAVVVVFVPEDAEILLLLAAAGDAVFTVVLVDVVAAGFDRVFEDRVRL